MKFSDEYFENYWQGRIYRHPEDNKKQIKIWAKKIFKSGWETGRFELSKSYDEPNTPREFLELLEKNCVYFKDGRGNEWIRIDEVEKIKERTAQLVREEVLLNWTESVEMGVNKRLEFEKDEARKSEKERILKIIDELKNPYPLGMLKEPITEEGRFWKFGNAVCDNCKEELKKRIEKL